MGSARWTHLLHRLLLCHHLLWQWGPGVERCMHIPDDAEQAGAVLEDVPGVELAVADDLALGVDVTVHDPGEDNHVGPLLREGGRAVDSNEQRRLADCEREGHPVLGHVLGLLVDDDSGVELHQGLDLVAGPVLGLLHHRIWLLTSVWVLVLCHL